MANKLSGFFNSEAPGYTRNVLSSTLGTKYVSDLEVKFVRSVLSRINYKRVFEVGPGTGRFTKMFLRKADRAVAVDLSKEMISEAKSSLRNNKVKFINANVETLNLTPHKGKFDLLVCMRVFKYFKTPKSTINKFSKIIKPGGTLIVEYANKYSYLSIMKWFYTLFPLKFPSYLYVKSLCLLSRRELFNYYRAAGLNIIEIGYTPTIPYFIYAKINSSRVLKPFIYVDKILSVLSFYVFARDLIIVAEKTD